MVYVHVRIIDCKQLGRLGRPLSLHVVLPTHVAEMVQQHLGSYTSGGYWSREFKELIQLPGAFVVAKRY